MIEWAATQSRLGVMRKSAMRKREIIELRIETMAHGGEALGRHNGKVFFVQEAIPGELVRAEIVEDRRRWARAQLLSVLDASPFRIEPPCPYFGRCGGCQWQHVDYDRQLEYKRQVLLSQLRRLGHLPDALVRPTIGMAQPWHYRNHVQFAQNARGQLGFREARSHQIVAVQHCLLLHPLLEGFYGRRDWKSLQLRQLSLRAGIHTGERLVILETADDLVPEYPGGDEFSCVHRLSDGTHRVLSGEAAYHERLRDRQYHISASSFFQVNTLQAEALLGIIQAYTQPKPSDTLLDVYCGVGAIGLSMHADLGRVIGIEEHPAAVQDARINAQGVDQVTFLQGKAEVVVPELEENISKVVVDPPRSGCKAELIDALVRLAPLRLVYVSCDPATLARDAARLTQDGYELVHIQPVDMFPQTYHIETVSLWQPLERHNQ